MDSYTRGKGTFPWLFAHCSHGVAPVMACPPAGSHSFQLLPVFIYFLSPGISLPAFLRNKGKAGQCSLLQGQHPSLAGPGCVLKGTSWETAAPPPRPEAQLPRVPPPSDPSLKVTTYVFLQYCLLLFIPPKFVYLIPYVKFSLLKWPVYLLDWILTDTTVSVSSPDSVVFTED